MEPFFATCSPMRPAMLIYVKNCIFRFWGLWLKPQKVDFRQYSQKQRFSIKTGRFFLLNFDTFFNHLDPFWHQNNIQHATLLIFPLNKNYFSPSLTHSITFLAKNTAFWAPILAYGKPDTYDPLKHVRYLRNKSQIPPDRKKSRKF